VRDGAFRVPGSWTFRECADCGIVYLDPRPSRSSIGKAYASYYTHEDAPFTSPAQGVRRIASGAARRLVEMRDLLYVKLIWPTDSLGGRVLGPMFEKLAPRPIAAIAGKLRHLQPAHRDGARFLDIGCGDGAFLPMAETLGYAAQGLDPDPVAVKRGRAQGRDVTLGSLEANDFEADSFEQVTMAHVLEHLHDPVAALDEVYRLLCPGGRLWITQPNIGALGLVEFGPNWRGLEPPRHMVLMTAARLTHLLESRGYVCCEHLKPPYEAAFYYSQSVAIQNGEDPNRGHSASWSPAWRNKAREADARAFCDPAVCESMTVVAYKPC
jgi:SAM-dependent methyltransferase